jgi:hypothetical protein
MENVQQTKNKSNSILEYEAPFLEEKLLAEGKFNSSKEYDKAFLEFKRYACLVSDTNLRLPMISKPVDEVWHQFILFTNKYMEFCNTYMGSYLHHTPNTSYTQSNSISTHEFKSLYQRRFGDLDQRIWGIESWCESGGCGNMCGSGCGNDCYSCGSDGND